MTAALGKHWIEWAIARRPGHKLRVGRKQSDGGWHVVGSEFELKKVVGNDFRLKMLVGKKFELRLLVGSKFEMSD